MVSQRMAGNGRTEALPDKANPVSFSRQGAPTAYLPLCVTEAKYLVNVAYANDRQYSRNLGKREGIELLKA
jgi:hypothetical protein